jgi:hypothetical protein
VRGATCKIQADNNRHVGGPQAIIPQFTCCIRPYFEITVSPPTLALKRMAH